MSQAPIMDTPIIEQTPVKRRGRPRKYPDDSKEISLQLKYYRANRQNILEKKKLYKKIKDPEDRKIIRELQHKTTDTPTILEELETLRKILLEKFPDIKDKVPRLVGRAGQV